MKHKFKIGLYDEDPFELVSKNFQEEMEQIHDHWCPGLDDRIYTKTSHAGETRHALRVYPDEPDNIERDEFLDENNLYFYCDSPKNRKAKFEFSGFWEAENYFAETTQLLDYNIHNIYEFDDGKLNGTYLSYAVIDFEQLYERFCDDLWDSARKVFGEAKLNKYSDKFDDWWKDKKVFKEFINILHFLNPSLNIYQNSMSDCELIDEVSYPLLKSKVEFYASKKNHNNFSLDEIFYDKSQPLYFVFETGFFINNAKNGVFERFLIEDNSQKIARKQYKDDVIEEESLNNFKINNDYHVYQSD
jgi:hypothetical protein